MRREIGLRLLEILEQRGPLGLGRMRRKDLEWSEIRGSENIVGRPRSASFSSRAPTPQSLSRTVMKREGIVPTMDSTGTTTPKSGQSATPGHFIFLRTLLRPISTSFCSLTIAVMPPEVLSVLYQARQ